MGKESFMAYSKVLTQHFSGGAEQNHVNLSEQSVAQPRQTEHLLNARQALPIEQVLKRAKPLTHNRILPPEVVKSSARIYSMNVFLQFACTQLIFSSLAATISPSFLVWYRYDLNTV
jgi:hypothetical protein